MISITYQLADLPQVAAQILAESPTRIFTLAGQMGAGKTTLVAAFGHILQSQDVVASPTFPIVNQYQCANNQLVYHLDLYRLKNGQEAIDIGIEDILYDKKAYIFIEWHELIEELLPENTAHICIQVIDENTRTIDFSF
ncbi:MAG: hypothetical protein RI894_1917 [Bacteroidota bacterium]|jgi:tRNA threonylcarbamoyladenosine biosynthesis protein TsaE